jgi:hypothetical protein
MMASQHLQTLATCPFDTRKLSMEKVDTWTNMQWTTTYRPAIRGLQLWTTSNRSSQATHCRNPDIINEVAFQRNNLSYTQEGKHRSIHKLVQMVQVLPFGFSKKGTCWDPWLQRLCGPETFSNVRLCSGHFVKSFQLTSTWPHGTTWEKVEPGSICHAVHTCDYKLA